MLDYLQLVTGRLRGYTSCTGTGLISWNAGVASGAAVGAVGTAGAAAAVGIGTAVGTATGTAAGTAVGTVAVWTGTVAVWTVEVEGSMVGVATRRTPSSSSSSRGPVDCSSSSSTNSASEQGGDRAYVGRDLMKSDHIFLFNPVCVCSNPVYCKLI